MSHGYASPLQDYQHGWGLHIYAPSCDFVRLSNYLEG